MFSEIIDPLRTEAKDNHKIDYLNSSKETIKKCDLEDSKFSFHICEICKKEFVVVDKLIKHIQETHNDDKSPSQCIICNQLFVTNGDLRIHMDKFHKNARPYRCIFCSRRFLLLKYMNQHIESAHHPSNPKPYKCSICRETFTDPITLQEHMGFKHKREIKCTHCIKCFSHKTQLANHMKTHSFLPKTSDKNSHLIVKVEYCCTICDILVQSKEELLNHMDEHIGDPYFECPDCGDVFESLRIFNDHMAEHTNKLEEATSRPISPTSSIASTTHYDMDNEESSTLLEPQSKETEIMIEYFCEICQKVFFDAETFDVHQKTHLQPPTKRKSLQKIGALSWQAKDNKIRPYKCDECDRSFTLASTLTLHNNRVHLGLKPYKCSTCNWSFAQSSDLIKHERKHNGERPFHCEKCGLFFSQKRNLDSHLKAHSGNPNMCKYCKREFKLETSLFTHMKKHEGDNLEYCDHCNIPYSRLNDLIVHLRKVHNENSILYTCSYCDEKFELLSKLKKHERKHNGEKPYKCKICPKSFAHPTSLKNHAVTHTGEKSYQCVYCGQSFAFAGNLKVHTRIHTGERPYECYVCHKTFARTANLNEHIKTHTGERNIKCEYCEKSFSNKSTYAKHKKIHTGEKKHKCTICEKSFIQLAHLTKHIRTHTGERPYECPVCKKCFRRDDTLKAHLKIHERTEQKSINDNGDDICLDTKSMRTGLNQILVERKSLYQCNSCDQLFADECGLKIHAEVHSVEQNTSKCTKCDKTFATTSNLKKHIKTHAKEGNIKRENVLSNLSIHGRQKKINAADRHLCTICQKSFARLSGLTKHKLVHTEEVIVFPFPENNVINNKPEIFCPNGNSTIIIPNEPIKNFENTNGNNEQHIFVPTLYENVPLSMDTIKIEIVNDTRPEWYCLQNLDI